jgi:hypothetical protein
MPFLAGIISDYYNKWSLGGVATVHCSEVPKQQQHAHSGFEETHAQGMTRHRAPQGLDRRKIAR